MKTLTTLVTIFLLAVSAPLMAGTYAQQKVVYHVNSDDPATNRAALGNIQNHINAVGAENLDLRVVMHGNGLGLILLPDALGHVKKFKHANSDMNMQAKVDGLKNQGVSFKICANTIKGRNINPENDLYNFDEADVVPSGVAELAHLQAMGYTYIKP